MQDLMGAVRHIQTSVRHSLRRVARKCSTSVRLF
jgi:hypothetical protein